MKRVLKWGLCLLLVLILAVAGYVIYAYAAYYRVEDGLELDVNRNQEARVEADTLYKIVSYNVGFGAYSADYSFFMDGGRESRARSKEAVEENIGGALEAVASQNPQFVLFQEVDIGSTRSYQADERAMIQERMAGYGGVFAQNYDSPYLFWPLNEPHGKSRSGMLTLSAYRIGESRRRSLPVEEGLWKFLDLDRCYSVSRLPVDNGRELVLINAHLSAYTKDGSIADAQLRQLAAQMLEEYQKGNYVICGGDFNKDLLGDSSAVFGVSGEEYSWAQPFPVDSVPEGFTLVAPLDEERPVASCRNADRPYDAATAYTLTVDGFLVSDNVSVEKGSVVDTGFAWSDHNPVYLDFRLNGET
ncbi:endonuclease/exonuclease/phosphatase family protein [Oscillibacter hominis]|uniref:Endonuclease/exonuclease/phosphatase family protein n=1 Tax=Oscillibacter hominis TaxID=2763056 RepID=A0A7G9B753_9FIRM|nr:endonuclease/exonuclease/phosphatase family protein [Oscillibacter hominis]QNL45384.1 endonuclease/exonuclease/phosphatase family protein [Oscillibacter hominis]